MQTCVPFVSIFPFFFCGRASFFSIKAVALLIRPFVQLNNKFILFRCSLRLFTTLLLYLISTVTVCCCYLVLYAVFGFNLNIVMPLIHIPSYTTLYPGPLLSFVIAILTLFQYTDSNILTDIHRKFKL